MVPSLTSPDELTGLDLREEFWSHPKSFQKDELCAVGGSEALSSVKSHLTKYTQRRDLRKVSLITHLSPEQKCS